MFNSQMEKRWWRAGFSWFEINP